MNRDLVLSALHELSDPDFQTRSWSGNEPGVMASFIECVEALFGDSGLSDALSSGVAYSDEVDKKLLALDAELELVDATQPIHALLSDPALERARKTARTIMPMLLTEESAS